jgi:glycolate oxidase iron-sulfur subunit
VRLLGEWTLKALFAHRGRLHLAADALRLGQRGAGAALLRSGLAQRLMPEWARHGFALTPPILPRRERTLERVAESLPAGARMETRPAGLAFVPAGPPRARVAWFASCVMEVMFPAIEREAVRLLVIAGCDVLVPRGQTCCGALHAHAGLRGAAKDLATRNVRAFSAATFDYVVTDSAGCGAALRDSGHLLHRDAHVAEAERFAGRVRDVAEVLAELGLPAPPAPLASPRDPARPLRVGYHDPCHLAHAQQVRVQPRTLLRGTPGVELVDLPNSDWCCGSAGVYNLTHPEMAGAQLGQKLDSIERTAPDVVVASNPGCMLHMTRGACERGLRAPIAHLVEVLAWAHPAPGAARAAKPAAGGAAHPRA